MMRERAGTYDIYGDSAAQLRAKAEWARRLMKGLSDPEMVKRLGLYADELDAKAVIAETDARAPD